MMKIFAAWAACKRIDEGAGALEHRPAVELLTLGVCLYVMIRL